MTKYALAAVIQQEVFIFIKNEEVERFNVFISYNVTSKK